MGNQLGIDTNIVNNLSFKNLLELPNKNVDPESVYDELRQLELEVEAKDKRNKKLENSNYEYDSDEELKYEDAPMIPTKNLILPEETSDFIETTNRIKGNETVFTEKENIDMKLESNDKDDIIITPIKNTHDLMIDDKISKMIKDIDVLKSNINDGFNAVKGEEKSENLANEIVFKEHLEIQKSDLKASLSNNSIASTLTNLSQQNSQQQWSLESLAEWVRLEAHVIVSTNSVQNKRAYIRFVGPTKFAHGTWIGVELEQPFGKNDGSLKGVRYFRCDENKGCFVRADKLSLVVNKV